MFVVLKFFYKYRFSLKILQIDDLFNKAIAVHQKVLKTQILISYFLEDYFKTNFAAKLIISWFGSGKEQSCKLDAEGVFCPVNRIQYKYPPFSENIDAIKGEGMCWWFRENKCDFNKDEANMRSRTDVQIYK